MHQKNKNSTNFRKIQLKVSQNLYNKLQQYTDEDHSLGKVIRYFIKEGIKKNEKEDD